MIRPAAPEDAPRVAAIWNKVIRETTAIFASTTRSEEEIATLAREDFFVHEGDGALLGFVRSFPFRAGNGYAFTVEQTIMVADGAQGKGVGRGLMDHLTAHVRARGKHSLWGVVTAENEAGLAFHRACGFREHGRLPEVGFKFGRWHDAVLMGLAL